MGAAERYWEYLKIVQSISLAEKVEQHVVRATDLESLTDKELIAEGCNIFNLISMESVSDTRKLLLIKYSNADLDKDEVYQMFSEGFYNRNAYDQFKGEKGYSATHKMSFQRFASQGMKLMRERKMDGTSYDGYLKEGLKLVYGLSRNPNASVILKPPNRSLPTGKIKVVYKDNPEGNVASIKFIEPKTTK